MLIDYTKHGVSPEEYYRTSYKQEDSGGDGGIEIISQSDYDGLKIYEFKWQFIK